MYWDGMNHQFGGGSSARSRARLPHFSARLPEQFATFHKAVSKHSLPNAPFFPSGCGPIILERREGCSKLLGVDVEIELWEGNGDFGCSELSSDGTVQMV